MTESKPPPPPGIVRQTVGSIVATPAATGHTYLPSRQFPQFIPGRKPSQVSASTGTTTTMQANAVTTQFHVPLQLGLTKTPLTVVTAKPNSGIHPASRPYPGIAAAPIDSHVKANVKPGVHKISHVKQVTTPKTIVSTALNERIVPNMVQAQIKKAIDVKPVLIGPGLRQPSKSHQHFQHQVTKAAYNPVVPNASRGHSVASWVVHQQDQLKTSMAGPPRTKPTGMIRSHPYHQADNAQSSQANVATVQDLSKKHNITHQPKTTISIMPALSDVSQRNLAISVSPSLSSVNKSVYQIMTPGAFQPPIPGQNPVKKLQTMIVTQVASSSSGNTGFVPSNPIASSGQITVMTGESGITYVPAPTLPVATNSIPIPIAKVYPQQQPVSRISVTTTSARLSVPVITSGSTTRASGVNIPRSTPTMLQVGTIKSSTATSTVMAAPTTIVSTIPVTLNKTSTATPLLCWQTTTFNIPPPFSHQPMSISTASPGSSQAAAISLTSTHTQHTAPANVTGRQPSHVFLVDSSRTTQLQAPTGSTAPLLQVSDVGRGATGGMGPTTPTVSPKPAILRRQRPDSSGALKKLSFQTTTSNFKSTDRRSAPYHLHRAKIPNSSSDTKANEIAVMIQPSAQLNEKSEVKPVMANQVHGKQVTSNGFAPIKVSNLKSAGSGQFTIPDSKEGSSYSIHSVNIDKVKMEPGTQPYQLQHNSVKPESASASQMLQYQSHSMHTYAAESPQAQQSLSHRILTQASGQHVKTNTIFASPGSYSGQRRYAGQANGRGKAMHVIKPGAHLSSSGTGPPSTQHAPYPPHVVPGGLQSNAVSSFLHSRLRTDPNMPERLPPGFEHIKKEQQTNIGLTAGSQHIKPQPPDDSATLPHNHVTSNVSPHGWTHLNSTDPMTGLSPRKRPRKQTHIVSEVPPEVEMMEDEESTDDADECEDEPMSDLTSHSRDTNTTPSSKMPGHKLVLTPRSVKMEAQGKRSTKEDALRKPIKSESPTLHTSESKPLVEYTDGDGVRYVATRKRPAVSVLNKLKPNGRSIANHFMRYSDIKVKDKKVTISDLASDRKRLKGFKVAMLASQLKDMVECEKDVWQRMQTVYNGLVEFKTTSLLGDATFEDSNSSPAPGTPTCLSNSFHKSVSTPRSARSGSISGIFENGPLSSPLTPLDRRTHKVQEEIVKIEELAQANLQRCQVVSDQMLETKTMLLRSLDHRQLACDILDASLNQKSQPASVNTPATKRMPKKKNSS